MHRTSVCYLYSKSELFGVVKEIFSLSHSPTRQRRISSVSNRTGGFEMDITGIAKSHQANSTATGKPSSGKEWNLSDFLWEKITGCGAERLYGE